MVRSILRILPLPRSACTLLVLLTALSSCRVEEKKAADGAPGARAAAASATVQVVTVRPREVPVTIEFTGSVRVEETVEVAPEIPGRIDALLAEEGAEVKAGDILIRLDGEEHRLRVQQADKTLEAALKRKEQLLVAADLEKRSLTLGVSQAEEALKQVQAKARIVEVGARPQERDQVKALVELSKARVDAAGRELARMQALLAESAVPRQTFEQAEDAHKMAQAEYQSAVEQLELVNVGARVEDKEAMRAAVRQAESALEQARTALGRVDATRLEVEAAEVAIEQARIAADLARLQERRTEVPSPVSGRVEKLLVRAGTVVAAGRAVVRLVPLARAEIQLTVQDEDRHRLAEGMKATYVVDALPGEGPFSATVRQVAEEADPAALQFPVRLEPAAEQKSWLKAGMFVRGSIEVGRKPGVLLVPLASVRRMEGRKVLFVVADGVTHKRYVTTGLRTAAEVEVVDGLSAGEQVVTAGQVGLVDGQPVNLAEVETNP